MKFLLIAIFAFYSCYTNSNTPVESPPHFVTTRNIDNIILGCSITAICCSKVVSIRYNIPNYYLPCPLDKYFTYPLIDKTIETISDFHNYASEYLIDGLSNNLIEGFKRHRTHFFVWIDTIIDIIRPEWVDEAKKLLQVQTIPEVNNLPEDCITIAVHVRKGTGGFSYVNDGEMISHQLFEHDRNKVTYLPFKDWVNYPFESEHIKRNKDGYVINSPSSPSAIHKEQWTLRKDYAKEILNNGQWATDPIHPNLDEKWTSKFPPEQYYIDQINWLTKRLKDAPLFVQIFTDDKDPYALIERIKSKMDNKNIIFYYYDNRASDKYIDDILIEDLYNISRFSIFIRGQSYFARSAELMGNHSVVLYPVEWRWEKEYEKSKNIMKTIVVKADARGELLFKDNMLPH